MITNIVIHNREELKKQINELCKNIYKWKIKIMNILAKRIKKDDRIFELVEEEEEVLGTVKVFLLHFMERLWEHPELVAIIIKNAQIKDLKEHLAPLFIDNFYENILSSADIEYNLIYVLTILLEEEINNLKDINPEKNFLNDTPCGYLLEEIRRKKDIQSFFKSIIFNALEDLEKYYSSQSFNLNITSLDEDIRSKIIKDAKMQKDEGYLVCPNDEGFETVSLENNNFLWGKNNQSEQINFQKYLGVLDKNALERLIEENKNNKKIYDYCFSKLNESKSDEDIFSNKKFNDNLMYSIDSKKLLSKYKYFFIGVINFINSIIDKILDNFHLIPYSIKCLCKIISILILKKFPSINEAKKNSFVAKFFFGKLLVSILKNPAIEAFINNFIISENTINNLSIICKIINKLTSGNLYKSNKDNSNYTPFNLYFIEKIGKLFILFDHITNVRLPNFIEKYINKELPEDYEYNYFKENKDEYIIHRSTFFNLEQLKAILNIMNKSKKQIFTSRTDHKLKRCFEKLMYLSQQELFQRILNTENVEKKQIDKSKKKKINI